MTTTLERVRAKIVEVVPEILELKFGCKVKYRGIVDTVVWVGDHIVHVKSGDNETGMPTWDRHKLQEIIGRDIFLHDVLRALRGKPSAKVAGIGLDGSFFRYRKDGEVEWVIQEDGQELYWNLPKSLDDQLPDVHEFLLKILEV